MTLDDIKRLRELAGAATPQNLDSCESKDEGGFIVCPTCDGEGSVELIADYLNYDGKAIGVQFYGIGPEHLAAEAYFRAANPSTITALCDLAERALAQDARPSMLSADDVKWIVNYNAELGVMIGDQCFFLYKGHSLVYESGAHDDGRPMMFRPVFKREFGECAHPINHDDYSKIGTVSLHDSDEWREIPLVTEQAAQPVALDDERVAFEAWADSEGLLPHARAARWEGWQARALLSASSAADHSQPTEIGERLRKTIDRGVNANELRSLLGTAADECDRFYGGMMNWKATAQAKDKTIIELREQLASSAAGQVKDQQEIDFLEHWLNFIAEPIGCVCCGHGDGGECCGNPVPEYATLTWVEENMNARRNELVAALTQPNKE